VATLDFEAVAAALASRWAPGAVTPPTGLGNIRRSTADLPNRLTLLPCVLVMADRGDLAPGQGSRLVSTRWLVRFHFSRTKDLPRETNACRKWLGILIDQVRVGEQLGLAPPVAVARVASYRVGILPYQQQDYTGVELGVTVELTHGWSA
jgi:hypothetical protein